MSNLCRVVAGSEWRSKGGTGSTLVVTKTECMAVFDDVYKFFITAIAPDPDRTFFRGPEAEFLEKYEPVTKPLPEGWTRIETPPQVVEARDLQTGEEFKVRLPALHGFQIDARPRTSVPTVYFELIRSWIREADGLFRRQYGRYLCPPHQKHVDEKCPNLCRCGHPCHQHIHLDGVNLKSQGPRPTAYICLEPKCDCKMFVDMEPVFSPTSNGG